MAAGKFCASVPNRIWKVDLEPHSAAKIAVQFCLSPSCLQSSNLLPENVLRESVHPFRPVERDEPDSRF